MKKHTLVMMLCFGILLMGAPVHAVGNNFQEHKVEKLAALNANLSALQGKIACVQNAQNHSAMMACMPAHIKKGSCD